MPVGFPLSTAIPATSRSVQTAVSQAAATIGSGIQSTYIASPALNIIVTLAPPLYDGEVRSIVFGAATTVVWAAQAPAAGCLIPLVLLLLGGSVSVVYNAKANLPLNALAATWYQLL